MNLGLVGYDNLIAGKGLFNTQLAKHFISFSALLTLENISLYAIEEMKKCEGAKERIASQGLDQVLKLRYPLLLAGAGTIAYNAMRVYDATKSGSYYDINNAMTNVFYGVSIASSAVSLYFLSTDPQAPQKENFFKRLYKSIEAAVRPPVPVEGRMKL